MKQPRSLTDLEYYLEIYLETAWRYFERECPELTFKNVDQDRQSRADDYRCAEQLVRNFGSLSHLQEMLAESKRLKSNEHTNALNLAIGYLESRAPYEWPEGIAKLRKVISVEKQAKINIREKARGLKIFLPS